jgi:hypothetical protein
LQKVIASEPFLRGVRRNQLRFAEVLTQPRNRTKRRGELLLLDLPDSIRIRQSLPRAFQPSQKLDIQSEASQPFAHQLVHFHLRRTDVFRI